MKNVFGKLCVKSQKVLLEMAKVDYTAIAMNWSFSGFFRCIRE